MAIDRLSSTAALIASLRAGTAHRADAARRRDPPAGTESRARVAGSAADIAVLRRQLVDEVRGKDIADPAAVRQLRPVIVRAILLWELGDSLRDHPDWQLMFDGIVAALEGDARQVRAFAALLAELQREDTAARR